MRYLLNLLPLLVFGILIAFMGANVVPYLQKRDSATTPLLGKQLPALDLPAVGMGQGVSSEMLKGRLSLVNVFATWCVPCRSEHPFLMELKGRVDVPVYGIYWRDTPENLNKWLAEMGNPYEGIGNDVNGEAAIALGVTGAPETFVVAPDGTVLYRLALPLDERILNDVLLPIINQEQQKLQPKGKP